MKRIIRLILVVSLLLIALLTFTASAAPADFTYTMKGNGTAIITGYKSNDVNVYIPKMLDGYTVSTIADNAFEGNKTMMTVNIPDTVTSIGDKAFFECENLNGVTIPASVQSIGIGAFAGCEKGLSFAVDKANPVYTTIDQVLYNKKTKALACCPRGVYAKVPDGIVEISEYAFYRNGYRINATNVPESVKIIKEYAFCDCSVTLHSLSVDTIESYAFQDCYFEFKVERESCYEADQIKEYAFYNSIFDIHSDYGTETCDLTINCPIIENGVFEDCSFRGYIGTIYNASESNIVLPISTVIGTNAFRNSSIERITFSNELVEICDYAFTDATFRHELSIPYSVKKIGKEAFAKGKDASAAVKTNNVKKDEDAEIMLPMGLEFIGEGAFNFPAERTIIIPESVTEIGDNICDRKYGTLEVVSGSYAATYAAENGYKYMYSGEDDDLSWLN